MAEYWIEYKKGKFEHIKKKKCYKHILRKLLLHDTNSTISSLHSNEMDFFFFFFCVEKVMKWMWFYRKKKHFFMQSILSLVLLQFQNFFFFSQHDEMVNYRWWWWIIITFTWRITFIYYYLRVMTKIVSLINL